MATALTQPTPPPQPTPTEQPKALARPAASLLLSLFWTQLGLPGPNNCIIAVY